MTEDAERLEEIRKQFEYVHEISVEDAEFIVVQLDRANKRCAVLREALLDLKHVNNHTIEEESWRIDKALKAA